jgi:archaellin
MDLKPLADPVTDSAGVTHVDLEVTRTLLREVDQTQIFSMIRGRNAQRARAELFESLALRKDPEIRITPAWWPWLPLIPFNVLVEIK